MSNHLKMQLAIAKGNCDLCNENDWLFQINGKLVCDDCATKIELELDEKVEQQVSEAEINEE